MMLEALNALDKGLRPPAHTPPGPALSQLRVVAVITGKGPLKEMYRARMRQMAMRHVAVCTMWLEPSDYPALLGSADLGVCLHTSTSGLDLPMKVLDMYGCGLPVCAVGFPCLGELVVHNANGLVFSSAEELTGQLLTLFSDHPQAQHELTRLRDGVCAAEAARPRWAQNWADIAAPLVLPGSAHDPERGRRLLLLRLLLGGMLAVLFAMLVARKTTSLLA